jgi:hypothetical protein
VSGPGFFPILLNISPARVFPMARIEAELVLFLFLLED